jgi:hypothetical protein
MSTARKFKGLGSVTDNLAQLEREVLYLYSLRTDGEAKYSRVCPEVKL